MYVCMYVCHAVNNGNLLSHLLKPGNVTAGEIEYVSGVVTHAIFPSTRRKNITAASSRLRSLADPGCSSNVILHQNVRPVRRSETLSLRI